VSSEDVGLFTEILFPLFAMAGNDREILVRATFGESLADYADACVKFLEHAHVLMERDKSGDENEVYSLQVRRFSLRQGSIHPQCIDPSFKTFDVILADVQRTFLEHLQSLITDESIFVRRAILSKVTRLCLFFGRQTANDVILSHTITYLNDRDADLRRYARGLYNSFVAS
jgi:phosphoinositide-3-kinase regulatory subunit 4